MIIVVLLKVLFRKVFIQYLFLFKQVGEKDVGVTGCEKRKASEDGEPNKDLKKVSFAVSYLETWLLFNRMLDNLINSVRRVLIALQTVFNSQAVIFLTASCTT